MCDTAGTASVDPRIYKDQASPQVARESTISERLEKNIHDFERSFTLTHEAQSILKLHPEFALFIRLQKILPQLGIY